MPLNRRLGGRRAGTEAACPYRNSNHGLPATSYCIEIPGLVKYEIISVLMYSKCPYTVLSTSIMLEPESFMSYIVNMRTVIPFTNRIM